MYCSWSGRIHFSVQNVLLFADDGDRDWRNFGMTSIAGLLILRGPLENFAVYDQYSGVLQPFSYLNEPT